jgi:outer membrane immunogenic protein
MVKNWVKGVAIAALTAAGVVAAQAADLPTRKEAPAPVFMPPPFTWTGFYLGLNAGGIFSSGSKNATLIVPSAALWLSDYFPGGLGSGKTGFIGGGQAGYNWQTGAFVLGIVTDFDGTTLSSSRNFTSAPFVNAGYYYNGDTLNVNSKASLDWLGTTRAKIGFVATPDNRLMIYGTGGIAYGGGSSHFNVFDSRYNAYWSGSPSSTRVGWTVGGGVEYAITNNWTIGGEYLYANLGSRSVTTVANPAAATFFPNVYATAKFNYNASIFRALVNYKF